MNLYKARTTNIMKYLILVVVFVLVVLIFSGYIDNIILTVSIVIGFYILSIIFTKKRVVVIKIDNQEREIVVGYRQYTFKKISETYLIDNVKSTYQNEIGPRGVKRKEFRLYRRGNDLIFRIIPNYHGWSEDDIEKIHHLIEG